MKEFKRLLKLLEREAYIESADNFNENEYRQITSYICDINDIVKRVDKMNKILDNEM